MEGRVKTTRELLLLLLLLSMQRIAVTLSRTKRCRALYNVNKYTTDALNTVPEMTSDRPTYSHWKLDRKRIKGIGKRVDGRQWRSGCDWGRQAVPRSWCSHWECTVAEWHYSSTLYEGCREHFKFMFGVTVNVWPFTLSCHWHVVVSERNCL